VVTFVELFFFAVETNLTAPKRMRTQVVPNVACKREGSIVLPFPPLWMHLADNLEIGIRGLDQSLFHGVPLEIAMYLVPDNLTLDKKRQEFAGASGCRVL